MYFNAHPNEPHGPGIATRLNWLRAGVLGANDGIVSVAAIVVGVAAATSQMAPASQIAPIFTAGIAGLVGGAVSMALGEYVSVSSSRDSQLALIAKEKQELIDFPDEELAELADLYASKGLSTATAHQVAVELTKHDALAAHLETEMNIREDDIASPWQATGASALAFVVGALLPLAAILLPPAAVRIPVTFLAVLVALAITGATSARIGQNPWLRATLRVVIGGGSALAATFLIGSLLGHTGVV